MHKEVKEFVRKETFQHSLYVALFYKGLEEHRNVWRVIQNQMKEEKVDIKMIHQGPLPCTRSIFGSIAEYFKYSIRQSQYMKEQPLYLC